MNASDLLSRLVAVTEQYLGPTAERFVRRQIILHLNKDPEGITREDIPKIAEWIKVSLEILSEDQTTVEDVSDKILKITK